MIEPTDAGSPPSTVVDPGAPLPEWLARHADDPVYRWAVSAWRRASVIDGAWFDEAKATSVVAAWPTIFRLTDDRFAGLPFILLPWQEITVRLLVGWKKPIEIIDPLTHRETVTHARVFRRLDLWIPRKNGKSEFLAALGVLFFVLEKLAGAQGFVFGRNEDQGRVPFAKMQQIIALANGLQRGRDGTERITMSKRGIYIRETRSLCQLLTGKPDGKHGRSPTLILGDEIHEWPTRELADNLRQGTGARLQPIELYASTAGRKTSRVGFEWFEESRAILDGDIDDDRTLVVLFAVEDDDDWTDEAVWRKANPSLGLTPTLEFLRGEYKLAKGRPAQEARFQAYHLNRWVDSISAWIPKDKWSACGKTAAGWKDAWKRHAGRRAFGACDVSATRDITALVWLLPPDDDHPEWVVIPLFWVPEETLDTRAKEDRRVDWARWVSTGALETTPGDVVDQTFVQHAILEGLGHFAVESVGFDPWNASKLMTDLQHDGMDAERQVEIRQGHRTLGEPTKSFEVKVFKGELEHGGHPVLSWMVGHCAVEFDRNLNYVPSKKASRDKIDGVVATVMALALAELGEEEMETTISVV